MLRDMAARWNVQQAHNARPALSSPTSLFWLPPRRLEQAPPFAIGLTPGRRLDLAPPATSARPVGRIAALAHHAFEPVLLRHAEQRLAVIERFGMQQHRVVETAHKGLQAPLTGFQRPLPEIHAI